MIPPVVFGDLMIEYACKILGKVARYVQLEGRRANRSYSRADELSMSYLRADKSKYPIKGE